LWPPAGRWIYMHHFAIPGLDNDTVVVAEGRARAVPHDRRVIGDGNRDLLAGPSPLPQTPTTGANCSARVVASAGAPLRLSTIGRQEFLGNGAQHDTRPSGV